jgi:hypothetical protein
MTSVPYKLASDPGFTPPAVAKGLSAGCDRQREVWLVDEAALQLLQIVFAIDQGAFPAPVVRDLAAQTGCDPLGHRRVVKIMRCREIAEHDAGEGGGERIKRGVGRHGNGRRHRRPRRGALSLRDHDIAERVEPVPLDQRRIQSERE